AADHLDHGRPLAAALCLERLRQSPGRAQFEPMLSLKTAFCWERAGMRPAALQALLEMQEHHPGGKLTIAGRDGPVFGDQNDALAWLSGVVGPDEPDVSDVQDQWTIAGGNAARNAESFGGSPYLNEGWRLSTIPHSTETPEQDQELLGQLESMTDEFHRS